MFKKLAFAVSLIGASPAIAGWQNTQWGMTPEEVVKASKGNAHIDRGEPGDRFPDSPKLVGAVGTHASGKWRFRTVFYFEDNKLAEIRAKLLNGEGGCGGLWADMKSAYGEPFDPGRNLTVWQDPNKNNRVIMIEILDSCSIAYQPLKNQNNEGL